MHRALITGAAGRIGTILRKGLSNRFDVLRLLDTSALGSAQPGEELVTADVRDLSAMVEAMDGVDAVAHLAGIPSEDTFERILETNIVGTYHVFEAARRQGCSRVVLASSLHVTGFYEADEHIGPDVPLRPDSFYGVGKAFAENLGRLYADKHGLQVVCVRIGTLAGASHCAPALEHLAEPKRCGGAVLPLPGRARGGIHRCVRRVSQPASLVGHELSGTTRLPTGRQRRAVGCGDRRLPRRPGRP